MDGLKKLSGGQIACIAVALVFLIGAGVAVMMTSSGSSAYEAKKAENSRLISQLTQELNSIEDPDMIDRASVVDMAEAGTAGKRVAELQTKYQTVVLRDMSEMDKYEAEVMAIASELSKYMGSGADDAQTPWFDPGLYNTTGKTFDWTFESSYNFSGMAIPVIWTCHDDDGNLVAYTTGTYSAATQTFTNISHGLTSYGQSYIMYTVDPESPGYSQPGSESDPRMTTDKDVVLAMLKDVLDWDAESYNSARSVVKTKYGLSDDSDFMQRFMPEDIGGMRYTYSQSGVKLEFEKVEAGVYSHIVTVMYEAVDGGVESRADMFRLDIDVDGNISNVRMYVSKDAAPDVDATVNEG